MPGKFRSIKQLKRERIRLIKLARKQEQAKLKKLLVNKEIKRLKREVSKLKGETSKKILPKLRRIAIKARESSPEVRERLKVAGNKLKKGFESFQKFADKYGD